MGDYYDIGYRLKDVMAEKGVTISQRRYDWHF